MNQLDFIKSKEGKVLVGVIGVAVLVLTGVHHYYRIKATKMQIEKLKQE